MIDIITMNSAKNFSYISLYMDAFICLDKELLSYHRLLLFGLGMIFFFTLLHHLTDFYVVFIHLHDSILVSFHGVQVHDL